MSVLVRIYGALFVTSFQAATQYRVQSVLWLLFAVIRPVVFLAAWSAAANAQGGTIGDFTVGDFAAYYVCLTLVSQLTMSWDSYDFEIEVRQGKLSAKLLRPLHPLHYAVVENIVFKVMTLPALVPALALIAWTFQARFRDPAVAPRRLRAERVAGDGAPLRVRLGDGSTGVLDHAHPRHHAPLRPGVVHLRRASRAVVAVARTAGRARLRAAFRVHAVGPSEILRGGATFDQAMLILGAQVVWLVVSWLAFAVVWRLGLRQFSAVGA